LIHKPDVIFPVLVKVLEDYTITYDFFYDHQIWSRVSGRTIERGLTINQAIEWCEKRELKDIQVYQTSHAIYLVINNEWYHFVFNNQKWYRSQYSLVGHYPILQKIDDPITIEEVFNDFIETEHKGKILKFDRINYASPTQSFCVTGIYAKILSRQRKKKSKVN